MLQCSNTIIYALLGFETARVLAMAGAHVFLACRNTSKANSAVQRILADNVSP